MNDIQTSTIRVPKNVLEEIKIYCRKAGKPVGEWVETAWSFLQKNDFDIYDAEATPFLPVPAADIIAKAAEEKVKAEFLEKELQQLREENKALRERYEKAHKELVRVQIEQKTIGKIKVNTEL